MLIDCGRCEMRGIDCQDCVVPVITLEHVSGQIGPEELRALGVLADAGMVPPLRLKISTSRQRPAPCSWGFPAAKAS